MSVTRLFVEAGLSANADVPLGEAQAHHLRHVMRRTDGAELLLFNGRDGEWRGTLALHGSVLGPKRYPSRQIASAMLVLPSAFVSPR